jgi:hypothetical protein
MSYTCGAATTDDLATGFNTVGANDTNCFVAGWWKPTTLTATRGLWSAGNIFGAEIDTTTSELRLRTDNTTDGQWTTTGVGLTVDQWKFLAFANSCSNTGPTASWVVWSGTNEVAPQRVTVTQATAPNGNFTGSANTYLGNKGTGTLAFQGQLGPAVFGRNPSSIFGYVPTTTAGTIAQEGIDYVYANLVLPIWLGNWCPPALRLPRIRDAQQQGMLITSLDYAGPHELTVTSGTVSFGSIGINGCTLSQERCPRPMPAGPATHPNWRVRR